MALKLMEFGIDIQYREGSRNGNADALSRQAWRDNDGDDLSEGSEDDYDNDAGREYADTSVDVPDGDLDFAGADLSGEGCGDAHKIMKD